jgi:Right handed beta helix region
MTRCVSIVCGTVFALCAPSAFAETVNCTPIGSLPATITTQGTHCLTHNLSTSMTSGVAITIAVNNVTLDLNGWKLAGLGGGTGTHAYGIYSNRHRVTVKNGRVVGFQIGVFLEGRGALVEDLLLDRNRRLGILVEGPSALVRRNRVIDTGGSTATADQPAYAILAAGSGSLIDGNMISGLTAVGTESEYGIRVDHADYVTVRDNVVSDDEKPAGGGSSWGIDVGSGSFSVVIVSNAATNLTGGIRFHLATGTYSHNVMVGCDTPYTGGTAGSDND